MIERRPPFGTEDLPPAETAGDLAGSIALGRELETLAAEPVPAIGPDWIEGVMAAVALEPTPQPVVAAGNALRAGRPGALLAAIVDAWRVGFGGGRPVLVRLPALALVLVAVVGLGSVATIGGYAGGRALGLFPDAAPVVPAPTPSPSPTPEPTPSPSPSLPPSPSPSPSAPPTPTVTPSASPTETASPGKTDELGTASPDSSEDDDGANSGSGSGNSGSGSSNSGKGSGDDGG
jgi:hypothetical protein